MKGAALEPLDLQLERSLWDEGYQTLAGLDEAGRGAWAGPVVAAAVVLPPRRPDLAFVLRGVHDSKRLTPAERERLLPFIYAAALCVGVGFATPAEVDQFGPSRNSPMPQIASFWTT